MSDIQSMAVAGFGAIAMWALYGLVSRAMEHKEILSGKRDPNWRPPTEEQIANALEAYLKKKNPTIRFEGDE